MRFWRQKWCDLTLVFCDSDFESGVGDTIDESGAANKSPSPKDSDSISVVDKSVPKGTDAPVSARELNKLKIELDGEKALLI